MDISRAGRGGCTRLRRGGVPIKYTVRFMEVEGLGWRDGVFTRLTPVTRQGAATVWTAPADVAKRMVACAAKSPSSQMIQAPTVIAWAGMPAHITTRNNRRLVTQVAWAGDDGAAEARPETVHTGSAASVAGRKMDQGVLVQMVLQDTQIVAVHRVAVGGPGNASSDPAAKKAAYHGDACEGASSCCDAVEKSKKTGGAKLSFQLTFGGYRGITLPEARYMTDDVNYLSLPDSSADRTRTGADPSKEPTYGTDPSPKATSGVVAASVPASECCSAATSCTTAAAGGSSQAVTVEVPEIGSQEIAGEWLIPNDGILLVSFGPHTVADKDGKAVIRERLAIVEADEAAEPIGMPAPRPAIWGTPVPAYAVPIVPAPAAMAMPPTAVTPSPSAVPRRPPR